MKGTLPLGQMFVAGFRGCEVESGHWIAAALVRDQLGGVLLFERNVDGSIQNISSPRQVKQLVQSIRRYSVIPPFIAVDQEGGKVCRFKKEAGFALSRSAAELASEGVTATSRHAAIMATELADCGVNLNFAPVVDLDLNPDNPIIGRYERSFGSDASIVVAHARTFIEAHHRRGIGCCLKHFPGHGSAGSDSHHGFVDVTDCWQSVELEPYRRLIASGYSDGIMTAHLVHQHLDPSGMPATLSSAVIDGLLRRELCFSGVVFSDDLQMRAIGNGWSFSDAVQRAVLAGVDVLVIGNNLDPREDAVREGIRAIEALLDSGRIDANRINFSLGRIARFKEKITGKQPWTLLDPPTVSSSAI